MFIKRLNGEVHLTAEWSKVAFIIFALALFGIGYMASTGYTNWDWRVELHENAHIAAYGEQGIEAWRESKYSVGSFGKTVYGVRAGYQAELDNVAAWMFWLGIIAPILGLATGFPFWGSTPLGFCYGMYRQLIKEMGAGSSDIAYIARSTGVSTEAVINRMASGAFGTILLMGAVYLLYLFLIVPPEHPPRQIVMVPASRVFLQPTSGHTSLNSFGTSGLLIHEEDAGRHVPRAEKHRSDEENEPQDPHEKFRNPSWPP